MTNSELAPVDVVIVGAGIVGATLACLLGEAGVEVALLDARGDAMDRAAVGKGPPAQRVSALTPVSQRLFEGLGVWTWIAGRRASPYRFMQVWDAQGQGRVSFSAQQAGVPLLGHIVENDVVLAALERRLAELPGVRQLFSARVAGLTRLGGHEQVMLEDGRKLRAPLVVAADGARSRLRDLAGIDTREHDTGHVAVVMTVQVARPHGEVARQVFLPSGPLAFLPLLVEGRQDHCSIVWSTSPAEAERLLALPPDSLGHELAAAFDERLGEVSVIDRPLAVPLSQRHATHYTQAGFALVGDAAHSIHPLAGQGVNLGLMDAAVLAEELIAARHRGIAPGEPRILDRYARRRRSDNTAMLALMDGFRLLFAARHPAVTLARNLGMRGIDRLSPVKRLLMQQATGHRGRLPRSCR